MYWPGVLAPGQSRFREVASIEGHALVVRNSVTAVDIQHHRSVCVGLAGCLLTTSRLPVQAGKEDPSPVAPGAEVVWPKGSEWKPGDNGGFPEPLTPAVSEGLPTSTAPQFVTDGKNTLPEVSDGEVEMRVGPQSERRESISVEHGAPMQVSPVSVESKSSLVEKGFRSPDSVVVSVIGSTTADVAGVCGGRKPTGP